MDRRRILVIALVIRGVSIHIKEQVRRDNIPVGNYEVQPRTRVCEVLLHLETEDRNVRKTCLGINRENYVQ